MTAQLKAVLQPLGKQWLKDSFESCSFDAFLAPLDQTNAKIDKQKGIIF